MSYSVEDLEKLTGLSRFKIRHYVRQRIIPTTTPNGPNTRYTDVHLHRLLAVRTLMAAGMSPLGAKQQLDVASPERLLQLAGIAPPTPPAPPPAPAPAPVAAPVAETETPKPVPYRAGVARAREIWEHIAICPGVELRVNVAADTEARRVAREIEAAWGMREPL